MSRQEVVILGAGPAGLAAAHECGHGPIRPLVLEKSAMVGGIARTETYRGYYFDIGGHRFFTKNQRVDQLWREMMGDDYLRVTRMSRIYYQGRFFNYPLSCFNALRNLGVVESVLVVLSYLRAQVRAHPVEESFEQWVVNRFGHRLYQTFFKTYTEKVWGIPCHEIRADWAAQRIKGLSLRTAVINALFKVRQSKTLIDAFDYPRLGPGMMWERFQQAIDRAGGRVCLQAEVVGLTHRDGRVLEAAYRQDGALQKAEADFFISSLPITALVRLLDPPAPAPVLAAAEGLSYRAFLIVGLILQGDKLFPDQWIYVHSPEVTVGRIQNFRNWSSAMVPDPATSSIGMEYFCDEGDDLWQTSNDELIELAGRELVALGLARQEEILDGVVIRQPGAYPIYNRAYSEHLMVIRDFLAGFVNLQTIGRNGMHRYNNMDHSMLTGMQAVENLRGAGHELWSVNEEEEYLEEEQKGAPVPADLLVRTFARMDKLAFATALGMVTALLVCTATLWIVWQSGDPQGSHLRLLAQYFMGYTVTVPGSFIAFGYTFFWGFLLGWLIAYLRNFALAFYVFRVRKKNELLTVRDFFDHL